jgi:hypothetical protein
MRKTIAVLIAVLTVGLWFSPRPAHAQDESKGTSSAQPAKPKPPVEPYRLDFSFNEVLDGKTVNSRHYSLNLTAGESNEIKIGTRVPVATSTDSHNSPSQFQYVDVGTNIWAQIRDHGDEWLLAVRSEISNMDTESADHNGLPPVIRQIKISGDTLLVVGKPIVIGSVDDPNSKRQFQLEVTVTKLR